MSLSRVPEFGICACGGTFENHLVEVRFSPPEGEQILLENVPQGACPVCGSRVYRADVLAHIESIFHSVQQG
jgi:YgiT-type zinc finger domain-containing protein